MSNIDPPKLKEFPYDKWVTLVRIWASDTSIADDKQANRVVLRSLDGQDQDAAIIEIGQTELTKETGLEAIITKLDELYKVDVETKQLYLLLEEFFNLKRPSDMAIAEYNNRFDRLMSKLTAANVTLPEPAIALTYLKNSNVSEEKASLVRSTATAKTLKAFKVAMIKGCERPSQSDLSNNVVIKEETVLYTRGGRSGYNDRGRSNNGGRFNAGRGRGGYSRGRGRGTYPRGDGGEQRDVKDVQCYRCKKYGHYANTCKIPWSEINYTIHGEEEMRDEGRSNQRRDYRPEECHISFSDYSQNL